MTADLQTRLLRVLSDRRYYRVGGRELVNADVRVLAATNRDLEAEVRNGNFREDLYHRLNVIRIDLPSLKERAEDIPLLARRFLRQSADELDVEMRVLSDESLARMMAFPWPGNVRQLENICRWITVMAPSNLVGIEDLPKELDDQQDIVDEVVGDWEAALEKQVTQLLGSGKEDISSGIIKQVETILLSCALDASRGHRQNAAKLLGWGRNTLTRKLKELDLDL